MATRRERPMDGHRNRRKVESFGRRILFATLVAASAICSAATIQMAQAQAQQTVQAGQKPNILVIFGDDIGQTDVSAYSKGVMGYMPFVEQGKVKALGVSTQQRFALLPQLPTIAESAVPEFDIDFFYGIAAPANVLPGVVERVSEAIREITELPDVWERMSTVGMSVHFRNSNQFRDLIAREYQKYGVIVHEAGIQPD